MIKLIPIAMTFLTVACGGADFTSEPVVGLDAGGSAGAAGTSAQAGSGGSSSSAGTGGKAQGGSSSTAGSAGVATAGAGGAETGGSVAVGGTGGLSAGGATAGAPSDGGAAGSGSMCMQGASVCGDSCPSGYYVVSRCKDAGALCDCGGGSRSECADPCDQPTIYVCGDTCPFGYVAEPGSTVHSSECGTSLSNRMTCTLQ